MFCLPRELVLKNRVRVQKSKLSVVYCKQFLGRKKRKTEQSPVSDDEIGKKASRNSRKGNPFRSTGEQGPEHCYTTGEWNRRGKWRMVGGERS